MIASAIGGGLGALLQGGDTEDVLQAAALGGIRRLFRWKNRWYIWMETM